VNDKSNIDTDEALLQQAGIAAMDEPNSSDLDDLQHYLASPEMGPLILNGPDALVWGSKKYPNQRAADLVTILPSQKQDPFSNLFSGKVMKLFFTC
jgi:hypothetical protein